MKKEHYYLEGRLKKCVVAAIDRLGYTFVPASIGNPPGERSLKKILLIRLDHIGDVLMTTPALRGLRKSLPGAEIHLLIKSPTHEVVTLNPYIDRIIHLNAPWTTTGPNRASWPEVVRVIRSLRKEDYDCVVDFRADLREALLSLFIGATYRLGYGARGGGFCFTHPLEYNPGVHEIHRAINLLSPLGVVSDGDKMDFVFSAGDLEKADTILREIGVDFSRKIVGIHPGAASPFKRWTANGFAELGDILMEKGYRILLLGAQGDKDLLQSIAGRMRNSPPVICKMNLKVLGAMISLLDCLVCNDSAPSHIAQAVGTKAFVLYGPTHDKVTGPLDREKYTVVRNPVPCSPCWLPGTKFECKHDLQCWKGLQANDVLKAAEMIVDGIRS